MDDLTFINLVRAMRNAQKEYFKKRDHNALLESRKLEAEVDKHIKAFDVKYSREQERDDSPELPF